MEKPLREHLFSLPMQLEGCKSNKRRWIRHLQCYLQLYHFSFFFCLCWRSELICCPQSCLGSKVGLKIFHNYVFISQCSGNCACSLQKKENLAAFFPQVWCCIMYSRLNPTFIHLKCFSLHFPCFGNWILHQSQCLNTTFQWHRMEHKKMRRFKPF